MSDKPQETLVQLQLPEKERSWPEIPDEVNPRVHQARLIGTNEEVNAPKHTSEGSSFKPDATILRWEELSPEQKKERIEEDREEREKPYRRYRN